MKKENKEMLKTIISNQELIMKALKIEVPTEKVNPVKTAEAKAPVKKAAPKKAATKKVTKRK